VEIAAPAACFFFSLSFIVNTGRIASCVCSRWAAFDPLHRFSASGGSFQHEAIDAGSFSKLRFKPVPGNVPFAGRVGRRCTATGRGGQGIASMGRADSVALDCWKFVERVNDRHLKKLQVPEPAGGGPSPLVAGFREEAVRKPDAGNTSPRRCSWTSVERDRHAAIDISNHSGEMQS